MELLVLFGNVWALMTAPFTEASHDAMIAMSFLYVAIIVSGIAGYALGKREIGAALIIGAVGGLVAVAGLSSIHVSGMGIPITDSVWTRHIPERQTFRVVSRYHTTDGYAVFAQNGDGRLRAFVLAHDPPACFEKKKGVLVPC